MISDGLKGITDQIKEKGKMRFLEAATEEQIALCARRNSTFGGREWKLNLQFT